MAGVRGRGSPRLHGQSLGLSYDTYPVACSITPKICSLKPTLGSRKRNGAGSFSHQPHQETED